MLSRTSNSHSSSSIRGLLRPLRSLMMIQKDSDGTVVSAAAATAEVAIDDNEKLSTQSKRQQQ